MTSTYETHQDAVLGGAMIGVSVALFMLFAKRTTGLSAIMEGVITIDPSSFHWKFLYVLGISQGVLITGFFFPEKLSFETYDSPKTLVFLVSGILVGFGTRLANGCTSGHGLVGTARFSPRSYVATTIFMGIAMIVATTIHRKDSVQSSTLLFEKDAVFQFTFEFTNSTITYLAATLVLDLVLTYVNLVHLKKSPFDHFLTIFASWLLGSGLVVSGMALPSKVVDFLVLDSTTWDPTLAIVLGVAFCINVCSIYYLRHTDPIMAKLLAPSATINRKLILGSACFGAGFGLTGICPGPSMALGAMFVPQIVHYFLPGFVVGVLGKQFVLKIESRKKKSE